jgi:hypothetical protein
MAQTTTKTRKKAPSRNGSSSASSRSKTSGSAKRSSSRTSSNGNASRARKPASTRAKTSRSTSARSKPRASAQSRDGSRAGHTVVEKAKGAAHSISEAASKAKTPLIVGGTALVGAAAGAVIKDRVGTKRSKNPLKRLGSVSIPRPTTKLDLSEIDLDKVKSAAERVSAYSQQASDIATAVQKTRKKNKS